MSVTYIPKNFSKEPIKSLSIYGAGMAGLLAAQMLRRHNPVVHEAQPSLPNNHHALLRFRSTAVSDATGIPFKKVRVLKAICMNGELHTHCDLRMANMYSRKVTGEVRSRSILNLDPVDRYIAPPDFISQLAKGVNIKYSSPLTTEDALLGASPAISTIPMPALQKLLGLDSQGMEFKHRSIWALTANIEGTPVGVYQTLYYPDPDADDDGLYRASITGNHIILEFARDPDLKLYTTTPLYRVARHMGIGSTPGGLWFSNIQMTERKMGKILPVENERARRNFILGASTNFNIYSLGRFATWRQMLLDDAVYDVKLIEQFINNKGDPYERTQYYNSK